MKKMGRNIITGSIVAVLLCLLSGCATTTFGVSNEEWAMLSPSQKQVAMQNYYREKQEQHAQQARVNEINAENAPLTDLMSGLESMVPEHTKKWGSSHSVTTGGCSGNSCQSTTNSSGSSTSITTPF